MSQSVVVVAAVNDRAVLEGNLAASPVVREGTWRLHVEEGRVSAAAAYNAGMAACGGWEVAVLAHQDVYLPRGWDERLLVAIEELERGGRRWGVLGVFGVAAAGGGYVGRVWSSGLGRVVGEPLAAPAAVVSLDELVLVVNAKSGLRFDEGLAGFHLYGTDIVQTALASGWGAYAFDGPVVHNSRQTRRLDGSYAVLHRYMRRKWRSRLPIPTTVVPLTGSGWPMLRNRLRGMRARLTRRGPWRDRVADPAAVAREKGFELAAAGAAAAAGGAGCG